MKLTEVYSLTTEAFGSPLQNFSPEEKREVDGWMKGNKDVNMGSSAFMKLMDFYRDEMPVDIQKARSGDPDSWILDKLETLPEYM